MTPALQTCRGCAAEIEQTANGRPRQWCSQRCRRNATYGGICGTCGAQTHGSNGPGTAPSECRVCFGRRTGPLRRAWTRDGVLAALRGWALILGDFPAFPDWDVGRRRMPTYLRRVNRHLARAPEAWPSASTVVALFGSWNAAVDEAGFVPRPDHGGGGNELRRGKLFA